MKARDRSSTAVAAFPITETLTDGSSCTPASELFARKRYLSEMGEELLWWMKTIWTEMRSLTYRIRLLHECRKDPRKVSCALFFEKDSTGRVDLSASTVARIEDTLAILSKYLWATHADMILALEGWDLGSGYLRRKSDEMQKS
jgi:hypothetical protein